MANFALRKSITKLVANLWLMICTCDSPVNFSLSERKVLLAPPLGVNEHFLYESKKYQTYLPFFQACYDVAIIATYTMASVAIPLEAPTKEQHSYWQRTERTSRQRNFWCEVYFCSQKMTLFTKSRVTCHICSALQKVTTAEVGGIYFVNMCSQPCNWLWSPQNAQEFARIQLYKYTKRVPYQYIQVYLYTYTNTKEYTLSICAPTPATYNWLWSQLRNAQKAFSELLPHRSAIAWCSIAIAQCTVQEYFIHYCILQCSTCILLGTAQ